MSRWFELAQMMKAFFRKQLGKSIVVQAAPRSFLQMLLRCRFTLIVIILNWLFFLLFNDSNGHLGPLIEQRWGFSWVESPLAEPRRLFLPWLLHWNSIHLNFDLIILIIFTGGLEYLAGWKITALCYIIPCLVADPLSLLIFEHPALACTASEANHMQAEVDVGAALGVFGCAGALSSFLRHSQLFRLIVIVFSMVSSFALETPLQLNYMMALFIGFAVIHFYFKLQRVKSQTIRLV